MQMDFTLMGFVTCQFEQPKRKLNRIVVQLLVKLRKVSVLGLRITTFAIKT
jgi:hypothetical protein